MKINLTEELLAGKSNNYKKNQADQAPQLIKDLFTIEGVKGVYHVADFLAVERMRNMIGKISWSKFVKCLVRKLKNKINKR